MDAAAWVTAIGTAALAVATFVYIELARDAAKAANRGAQGTEASAQFAALAIRATERATLAQSMPLLITQLSTISAHGHAASLSFEVHNVGRSHAVNGIVRYDGRELHLPPIPPDNMEPRVHTMAGVRESDETRPSGPVELEYQDAIGNRLRTVSSVVPGATDEPMYQTFLLVVGGWEPLKTT